MRNKTHEEYVAELAVKNPTVEVIGTYVGAKTKTEHHCLIHDVYWDITPDAVLRGQGCKMCGKDKIGIALKKTHKQYVSEVKIANINIVVIEQYINTYTPILHKCITHNVEWLAYPYSILRGCGCRECLIEKISKKLTRSNDEYVKELFVVNKDIVALEQYINARKPIKHKCLVDGCEWYAAPCNLLRGHGCPKCNNSNGEMSVSAWLDENGILYDSQKRFDGCKDKQALPFDFYLPSYNIAIEYNGKQHYEPIEYFGGKDVFEYTTRHDKIKEDYCKQNNIHLVKIPYFNDINEELDCLHRLIMNKEVAV